MVGALQNLPNNRNQPFSYNLIGQRTNVVPTFSSGRSFQDYIGTPALTSFPFVESIVTGQVQYNPSNPVHTAKMGEYANWKSRNPGAFAPQVEELTGFVSQIGEGIGSSIATGGFSTKSIMEGLPYTDSGMNVAKGMTEFSLKDLAAIRDTISDDKFLELTKGASGGTIASDTASKVLGKENIGKFGGVVGRDVMTAPGVTFKDRLNIFDKAGSAGAQNLRSAAGGAVGNFAVQLALGRDPVKAAKSAGAGAIGKILGNAIIPGFGGFLGGALGSIIGGRVICNELMRQGLLTRKEVVLDYKFTRDHLTPTHVNGYHVWAVWMVKQMRKGRFVKFWKHVAGHRANEIAYIYGERNKPDYLGKIYRKILEPTCWVIGSFCKGTDWSVLYKQKEI